MMRKTVCTNKIFFQNILSCSYLFEPIVLKANCTKFVDVHVKFVMKVLVIHVVCYEREDDF